MIRLSEFTGEHFDELAAWFPDQPSAVQWGGPLMDFPLRPDALRAMTDSGEALRPCRRSWMALDEDDRPVGHAQVRFDWRDGSCTLMRVAVAPKARGRGIAVPMLRLVLDDVFAFPDIERVELNVYDFNEAGIRTYRRLGFSHEGVRRSSVRVGAERWNTVIMGLLRNEWIG